MFTLEEIEKELVNHKVSIHVIKSVLNVLKQSQEDKDLISRNLKNILPGLK
tara:strand:- start:18059 stop:18211 length:153 start_codon:yes stop_codon:yes gene_type:complete